MKVHVVSAKTVQSEQEAVAQQNTDRRNNTMGVDFGFISALAILAGVILSGKLPFKIKESQDTESNNDKNKTNQNQTNFDTPKKKNRVKTVPKEKHDRVNNNTTDK